MSENEPVPEPEEKALVTRDQEMATAATLYGSEKDIGRFFHVVRKVAPWASPNTKFALSDQEVGFCVRRALAMGLDPLNPHEVQIWKDKRGNVNFQLAYTLMTEWVKHFKGAHTEPQFTKLTEADKDFELLDYTSEAFYAEFIMRSDFDEIERMITIMKTDPEEAREMFTVRGLGVANKEELQSDYFAPHARSKSWKIQKRAVVDAYRKKFGTPTRPDIMELRRIGAAPHLTVQDWKVAAESVSELDNGEALVAAAKASAENRKAAEDNKGTSPAEILEKSREALHGGGDVLEGEYEERSTPNSPWEPPPPEKPRDQRPLEQVRDDLRKAAGWSGASRKPDEEQGPPSKAQVDRLAYLLDRALGDGWEDKIKPVNQYLWKRKLCASLELDEFGSMVKWLEAGVGSTGLDPVSVRELYAIIAVAKED